MRKFTLPKGRQKIRQVRNFKNFVENDFIWDVSQLPWEMVYQFGDPNLCWQVWKSLLLDALNRHAPLRHKRIRNNGKICEKRRIKYSPNVVQFEEVIIINKLMKSYKMFTVKRIIIIYQMQTRFIRSE